jgi:hypothetical protein
MQEVMLFHPASKTLILVDLVVNFTDNTPGTSWAGQLALRLLLRLWNSPGPAPEYHLGWSDREAARLCLERVMRWDFRRVIMAHGDILEQEQELRGALIMAWEVPLLRSAVSKLLPVLVEVLAVAGLLVNSACNGFFFYNILRGHGGGGDAQQVLTAGDNKEDGGEGG